MSYLLLEYALDRGIRPVASSCRLKPLRTIGIRFPVDWRKGVEQMNKENFLNV
jgi:hypothetical protein